MILPLFFIIVATLTVATSTSSAVVVNPPTKLRTHYDPPFATPLAAPVSNLTLRWIYVDPLLNGALQSRFQVQVATQASGDLVWDSGEVTSIDQEAVVNITLQYATAYQWRVRGALRTNTTDWGFSDWSVYAFFDTHPSLDSWSALGAQWIGGHSQLRGDFTINNPAPITRARVHVAGMGAFYLFINGQRVGDHVMDPPQTVYPKRIVYSTFAVEHMLTSNYNVLGLMLGNYKWGYTDVWCNMTTAGGPNGCRTAILQLTIDHASGPSTTFTTRASGWVGRQGPVTWDHLFHGETYDARNDLAGWAEKPLSSWPQGTWTPTMPMNPPTSAPGQSIGPLFPFWAPPIRKTEQFAPISLTAVTPNPISYCSGPAVWGAVAEECEPQPSCQQNIVNLECESGIITAINFVSFGTPIGNCNNGFKLDPTCDAPRTATIAHMCVGRSRCTLEVSVAALAGGVDPCPNVQKRLAIAVAGCKLRTPPPPPGNATQWIYDFGQNMAGYATLHTSNINLPAGTTLRMEYSEILHSSGDLYNTYCTPNPSAPDMRHEPCAPHQTYGNGHMIADRYIGDFNDANMTNVYISNGTATSDYTPLFAAAGYRYLRLSSSVPITPALHWFTGHFVHTDVREVGTLTLANVSAEGLNTLHTPNVLNNIHHLWRYSQLSNLWSIPTDCPQRERRGWMGDAQVSCDGAMFHFDMQPFYAKFMQDMRDDQAWGCASTPGPGRCSNPSDSDGSVADVVPFDGIGGWPGCPVWQVAYIVIARNAWRHYGDLALLNYHYPGLVKLMKYFITHADSKSGLLETECYGDWIDIDCAGAGVRTPAGSVTAFYYVYALQCMKEIATAIGNPADADYYANMLANSQAAYHRRYYSPDAFGYSPVRIVAPRGSQTSNAMALAINACPDPNICDITSISLVEDVIAQQNHSTSGIVGMAWVYRMLSDHGFGDTALSMMLQDTFPSFGRMVAQDLTALCESWHCTEFSAAGASMNHIMFGGFHSWFSTHLAGLDTVTSAESTGWRHVIAAPMAASILRLQSAAISVNTRFGLTDLAWSFQTFPPILTLNLTVPIGSIADTHAPMLNGRSVIRMMHSTPANNNDADLFLHHSSWESQAVTVDATTTGSGVMEVSEQEFRASPTLRVRVGSGRHEFVFYYY